LLLCPFLFIKETAPHTMKAIPPSIKYKEFDMVDANNTNKDPMLNTKQAFFELILSLPF